ncbi:hypothetical protein OIU76_001609, partial [Salix suchowensis]
MDLLKQELLKKRQTLAQDTGGKKFFKRSEIQQKEIQKLREQEKRELEAKSQRQSSSSSITTSTSTTTPNSSAAASTTTTTINNSTSSATTSKPLTVEQNIDNLVLPKQEVIRRLRFLKQPITLFGEDEDARLDRLKYVLKAGIFEIDSDMTEGQTNDFLRDIAELRKRQKSGIVSGRKRKDREDGGGGEDGEGGEGDGELGGECGAGGGDNDLDSKRMKANLEELCEEDKILVFFKRLLNEWNEELDEMPEAEKRTAKGKSMVATFKQCARYLNPLFDFSRKK